MISAPRIRPLATATRVLKPDTTLVRTPPVTTGSASSVAARAWSNAALSIPSPPVCSAALSSAASTEAPISSVCSVTPRTVATTTTAIKASRPRTTRPAAKVGLNRWRTRVPTRGLKTIASTAAKVSGSTISLTAPSAVTTMIMATTNPTKLQAQTPSLGTQLSGVGPSLGPGSGPALGSRCALRSDWSATISGPGHAPSASWALLGLPAT